MWHLRHFEFNKIRFPVFHCRPHVKPQLRTDKVGRGSARQSLGFAKCYNCANETLEELVRHDPGRSFPDSTPERNWLAVRSVGCCWWLVLHNQLMRKTWDVYTHCLDGCQAGYFANLTWVDPPVCPLPLARWSLIATSIFPYQFPFEQSSKRTHYSFIV